MLSTNLRKITLFALLAFSFMISACSSQATSPNGTGIEGNTATTTNQTGTTPTPTKAPSNNGSGEAKFVYSGVEITLGKTDQQKKYDDDDYAQKTWTFRIYAKEHNVVNDTVYLWYNDTFRLLLPDGTSVAPQKIGGNVYIEQQIVRDTWYDFALDQKQDASKLTLRIGKNTDYQFTVPLSANPDLSKYAARSTDVNKTIKYAGLDWNLKKVTTQYYYEANQAKAGHRYIVFSFSIDNKSSETVYPFPKDYTRLAGSVTQNPEDSTLPAYFESGSTGTTGVLAFQMPENDSSFKLNFLERKNEKIAGASIDINL